jgi:hypothetical protein
MLVTCVCSVKAVLLPGGTSFPIYRFWYNWVQDEGAGYFESRGKTQLNKHASVLFNWAYRKKLCTEIQVRMNVIS